MKRLFVFLTMLVILMMPKVNSYAVSGVFSDRVQVCGTTDAPGENVSLMVYKNDISELENNDEWVDLSQSVVWAGQMKSDSTGGYKFYVNMKGYPSGIYKTVVSYSGRCVEGSVNYEAPEEPDYFSKIVRIAGETAESNENVSLIVKKKDISETENDLWIDLTDSTVWAGQTKSGSDKKFEFSVDMGDLPSGTYETAMSYSGETFEGSINYISPADAENKVCYPIENGAAVRKRFIKTDGNKISFAFREDINSEVLDKSHFTVSEIDPNTSKVIKNIENFEVSAAEPDVAEIKLAEYPLTTKVYRIVMKDIFFTSGERIDNYTFYFAPKNLLHSDFSEDIGSLEIRGYDFEWRGMWYDDNKITTSFSNGIMRAQDGSFNADGTPNQWCGVLSTPEGMLENVAGRNGKLVWKMRMRFADFGGEKLMFRISNSAYEYTNLFGVQGSDVVKIMYWGNESNVYNLQNIEGLENLSPNEWYDLSVTLDFETQSWSLNVNGVDYVKNKAAKWFTNYTPEDGIRIYDGFSPLTSNAKFDIMSWAKLKWAPGYPVYETDDYSVTYYENNSNNETADMLRLIEFADNGGETVSPHDKGIEEIRILYNNSEDFHKGSEGVSIMNGGGENIGFDGEFDEGFNEYRISLKDFEKGSYVLSCGGQSVEFIIDRSSEGLEITGAYMKSDTLYVSAANRFNANKKLTAYCAGYNGGRLEYISKHDIYVPAADNKQFKLTADDFDISGYENVKCFVWENGKPVCEATEIEDCAATYFDSETITDRMRFFSNSSNKPPIVEKNNKYGILISPSEDTRHLYFDIDDGYIFENKKRENVLVEIEYFDRGYGCFRLYYDDVSERSKYLDYIEMNNTGEWKKAQFLIQDGYFGNSLKGADLRISLYEEHMGLSPEAVIIGCLKAKRLGTESHIAINAKGSRDGNIFKSGKDAEFDLSLECPEELGGIEAVLVNELLDENGRVLNRFEETVQLPAETKIAIPIEKFGFYTLKTYVKNDSVKLYSELLSKLSYTPDLSDNKNYKIGVCAGSAQILSEAGIGWSDLGNNIDELYNRETDSFEYPPGRFELYNDFIKNGVYCLHETGGSGSFEFAPGEHAPRSEEGLELYSRYCRFKAEKKAALGSEYIGQAYELWNEYDGATNPDGGPMSDYVNFFKYAYENIKAVNPNALIMGPTSWLKGVMTAVLEGGAGKYMDVCSIHVYDWDTDPKSSDYIDSVKFARNLLDSYGYTKTPIWVTETGWADDCYGITTMQQGYYLVQAYAMLQKDNLVEKMFIYGMGDHRDMRGSREDSFGLVDAYGYAKPSFAMICGMNRMLTGAVFTDDKTINGDIYVYSFADENGENVSVCWTNGDGRNMKLEAETDASVYDVWSNEQAAIAAGGAEQIYISEEPVYIKGKFILN